MAICGLFAAPGGESEGTRRTGVARWAGRAAAVEMRKMEVTRNFTREFPFMVSFSFS